jgi:virginiamycin A acetyltransferase
MHGPDPLTRYPMAGVTRTAFLKPFITRPTIVVGDYTYYDDPKGPERFEEECVLYHFDFIGDRLVIGKFCSIAAEARFIMNGGNHPTDWLTTSPLPAFGHGWEVAMPTAWPVRPDTVVGNDAWIGYGATIMPGVRIGDGAIVATRSVVTKDVPPYAIVGGNPAQVIRMRFAPDVVGRLLALRWWDWDAERITRHVRLLCAGDLDALERAAAADSSLS